MTLFTCCHCIKASQINEDEHGSKSSAPCSSWTPSRQSSNNQDAKIDGKDSPRLGVDCPPGVLLPTSCNGMNSPPGPLLPMPSNLLVPWSQISMEPMMVSDGRSWPFLGVSPRSQSPTRQSSGRALLLSPRLGRKTSVGSISPERRALSGLQAQQLVRTLMTPSAGSANNLLATTTSNILTQRLQQFGQPTSYPQVAARTSTSMRDVSPPPALGVLAPPLLPQASLTSLPIERRQLQTQGRPTSTGATVSSQVQVVRTPSPHDIKRANDARQLFKGMMSPVIAVDVVPARVISADQVQPTSSVVTTPPVGALQVMPNGVELQFLTSESNVSFS